jgi:hypothetical protein
MAMSPSHRAVLLDRLAPARDLVSGALRRLVSEIFREEESGDAGAAIQEILDSQGRKARRGGGPRETGPELARGLAASWFSFCDIDDGVRYGGLTKRQVADFPARLRRIADEIERVNGSLYASPVQNLLTYSRTDDFQIRDSTVGTIVDGAVVEYQPRAIARRRDAAGRVAFEELEMDPVTKAWRVVTSERVPRKAAQEGRELVRALAGEFKALPLRVRGFAEYLEKPLEPAGAGAKHKDLAVDGEVRFVELVRATSGDPHYAAAATILSAVFNVARRPTTSLNRRRRARDFDKWSLERRCARHRSATKTLMPIDESVVFRALLKVFG